jgi:hypothetical protein
MWGDVSGGLGVWGPGVWGLGNGGQLWRVFWIVAWPWLNFSSQWWPCLGGAAVPVEAPTVTTGPSGSLNVAMAPQCTLQNVYRHAHTASLYLLGMNESLHAQTPYCRAYSSKLDSKAQAYSILYGASTIANRKIHCKGGRGGGTVRYHTVRYHTVQYRWSGTVMNYSTVLTVLYCTVSYCMIQYSTEHCTVRYTVHYYNESLNFEATIHFTLPRGTASGSGSATATDSAYCIRYQ